MGTFHAKMGSIKDKNGMDLTEAEDIKDRLNLKNKLGLKWINLDESSFSFTRELHFDPIVIYVAIHFAKQKCH